VTRSLGAADARAMDIAFLECINMIITCFHIILLFFCFGIGLSVHPNV